MITDNQFCSLTAKAGIIKQTDQLSVVSYHIHTIDGLIQDKKTNK